MVRVGDIQASDATISPGDSGGAERVVADLPYLPLKREHVGIEPQIEHDGRVPFLLCRVRLGLLEDGLEAAEQLQANRHEAAV